MGSSQSAPAAKPPSSPHLRPGENELAKNDASSSNNNSPYPKPTGHEYDAFDKIASELPNVIDDDSRQQVEDYRTACNNGKGPMVACFATGEYISLFERKHKDAAELYRNVCFRPKTDKSPNGVLVDGTKSYPAGCFNLAKMSMTGKGGVQYDNAEAYRLFDRACRGGHGGACYFQAQILCTRPGRLGPGVPHNPQLATQLYQQNCDNGDSNACFTLAAMLLRGERVSKTADNVSPQEARGVAPLATRKNEQDRHVTDKDKFYVIPRDPQRAEKLMLQACNTGSHVTACHNLVVMYTQGDDGVPIDQEKADHYAKKTQGMMSLFGGFQ